MIEDHMKERIKFNAFPVAYIFILNEDNVF